MLYCGEYGQSVYGAWNLNGNPRAVEVFDSITVTEGITVLIPTLVPSVFDTVTVTDVPTIRPTVSVSVLDFVLLSSIYYPVSSQVYTSNWNTNGTPVIVDNATTSPLGSSTAASFTTAGAFAGVFIYPLAGAAVIRAVYTFSVYLKASSGDPVMSVGSDNGTSSATIDCNTSTGAITNIGAGILSSGSQSVGSGWFRFWGTFAATVVDPSFIIYSTSVTPSVNFVWGAQFELGSSVTTYQVTTTSIVTTWNDTPIINIVATLNVSVFDAITVTEARVVSYSLPSPIVDTVTVTESIQLVVLALPSVFDSITVTDVPTIRVNALPTVFDAVTITENISLSIPLPVFVFDAITVTDVPTIRVNALPTVSDTVTITEGITIRVFCLPSVFDAITVTEGITIRVFCLPTVFDAITVTENIVLSVPDPASLFEAITVTESITLSIPLPVSVFEAITVTDVPTIRVYSNLLIFDTIAVTESITLTEISYISVFDSVSVSEALQFQVTDREFLFESITVSEDISLLIPKLFIDVSENIEVEVEFVPGIRSLEAYESINVTENLQFITKTYGYDIPARRPRGSVVDYNLIGLGDLDFELEDMMSVAGGGY